ncbi:DUF1788 domain-containing protein [Membranihabitans maritimus]|uniref:DUF1788 domain-containing protein n=1 Tax=Membranihabitans maritimus TaxID=2904244 RepID=UPI001F2B0617|nr:DUF1788 domain-containing protein [Membranihabitans maritimus]
MMPIEDIAEKFKHLLTVIQMEKFLDMEALGGEIPFFISTYNPEQELDIVKAIKGLKNKLETKGIQVLELNLYDICMNILDEQLGKGEIFELEIQIDKTEFKNALQSVLDIKEVVMPTIKSIIDANNARVYFITGVGNVYPFIRSHNILNNLQNVAKEAPTVMFFPGIYNGQSLELFGKLKDDNYYRAFNLDNYKI